MDLSPRERAFVLDEMADIENSETRLTSERHEASRIRKKAEASLTE
jgi:hypothetical protein